MIERFLKIQNHSSFPLVLVFLSFVLGTVLRFAWLSDIEFKGDEHYMYASSVESNPQRAFPSLGMNSGASARNPGMSVWGYSFVAKLLHLTTPEGLALVPILSLLLSVGLLLVFIRTEIPRLEQPVWLYTCALILVNPLLFLYSRKIWAQCLLPLFSICFFWSWWQRKNNLGAFIWGLFTLTLGQIHMSGFFFVPGFVVWSLWKELRLVRWGYFILGCVVGLIPALPWLHYLWNLPRSNTMLRLGHPFQFTFFLHWLVLPTGLGLHENFGGNFSSFLRYPTIFGYPTFLSLFFHLTAVSIALSFYIPWLWQWHKWRPTSLVSKKWDPSRTYIFLSSIVFGLLITYSGLRIPRHYLLVTYPLLWVWFCRLASKQTRWQFRLNLLWAAQLAITCLALLFIHTDGGAPQGDYGLPLRLQRQQLNPQK